MLCLLIFRGKMRQRGTELRARNGVVAGAPKSWQHELFVALDHDSPRRAPQNIAHA